MTKITKYSSNINSGWIKLYRKSFDNTLYFAERFTKWQAWCDLLLLANHKEKEVFIRGVKLSIKRGSLCPSMESLADRWMWNKRTVKKFLDFLESAQQISFITSNVTTTISIINYEGYQSDQTGSTLQNAPQNTLQSAHKQEGNKNEKEWGRNNSTPEFIFSEFKKEVLSNDFINVVCVRMNYDREAFTAFVNDWIAFKEISKDYAYSKESLMRFLLEDIQKKLVKTIPQQFTTLNPNEITKKNLRQ